MPTVRAQVERFGDQEKARSEWGAPLGKRRKPQCAALFRKSFLLPLASESDSGCGNQSTDHRGGRFGTPALLAPVQRHNDRLCHRPGTHPLRPPWNPLVDDVGRRSGVVSTTDSDSPSPAPATPRDHRRRDNRVGGQATVRWIASVPVTFLPPPFKTGWTLDPRQTMLEPLAGWYG
jgi:hypothetical protein